MQGLRIESHYSKGLRMIVTPVTHTFMRDSDDSALAPSPHAPLAHCSQEHMPGSSPTQPLASFRGAPCSPHSPRPARSRAPGPYRSTFYNGNGSEWGREHFAVAI